MATELLRGMTHPEDQQTLVYSFLYSSAEAAQFVLLPLKSSFFVQYGPSSAIFHTTMYNVHTVQVNAIDEIFCIPLQIK